MQSLGLNTVINDIVFFFHFQVVAPSSGFAQKLFEKIVDGLKLVKTQQSPSECKAVLASFMDCVKYFMSFGSRHWQTEVDQNNTEQLRTDVINMVKNYNKFSIYRVSNFWKNYVRFPAVLTFFPLFFLVNQCHRHVACSKSTDAFILSFALRTSCGFPSRYN